MGRDIAPEAFADMLDAHLTVCAPESEEQGFADAYCRELLETKNIRTVGWVDQHGVRFKEALSETGSLVYPPASGGQSTSVVCLRARLVLVVSARSGVAVFPFGHVLTECSVGEVRREARAVASQSPRGFEAMSGASWEYARQQHTREAFSREYRREVSEILGWWAGKREMLPSGMG
jgi:hypothetical protein